MELNGLPLDNTKKKRTESIVLPEYIALSYVMIWTFVKEVSLITTLAKNKPVPVVKLLARGAADSLYMSQPVRSGPGSVPAGPARPRRREGLCGAHAAIGWHPGGGLLWGLGHTPAWCSTKRHRARPSIRPFLPFVSPSLSGFFSSFPEHRAGSGSAVSRSSASPHGAAWSAEFANLSLLSRSREAEPVPGRPDPCQPRGVPGPRRAAAPLHPSPARQLPEGCSALARPLLLLPRPPGTGRAPGGRGCPNAVTWTPASEELRERQHRELPPVPGRHLFPIS